MRDLTWTGNFLAAGFLQTLEILHPMRFLLRVKRGDVVKMSRAIARSKLLRLGFLFQKLKAGRGMAMCFTGKNTSECAHSVVLNSNFQGLGVWIGFKVCKCMLDRKKKSEGEHN
jgi:hypothetical protein